MKSQIVNFVYKDHYVWLRTNGNPHFRQGFEEWANGIVEANTLICKIQWTFKEKWPDTYIKLRKITHSRKNEKKN